MVSPVMNQAVSPGLTLLIHFLIPTSVSGMSRLELSWIRYHFILTDSWRPFGRYRVYSWNCVSRPGQSQTNHHAW